MDGIEGGLTRWGASSQRRLSGNWNASSPGAMGHITLTVEREAKASLVGSAATAAGDCAH